MERTRTYAAIDLKSFYASVECVERGLNPLKTNLVVADESRTEKTICLAVSPSLKAYGIGGRARLFDVVQKVKKINEERRRINRGAPFTSLSIYDDDLKNDPMLELGYVTAVPRMALYIEYSTQVYQIYLKYVSPEDIHVYSIDEVFIDLTEYLNTYKMSARELTMRMIRDVLRTTGITATAGIGTNMFLAKVAMDIVAKHIPADEDGVRIASLDEYSYREQLWNHRPLTDFWRVGRGYAKKLEDMGLYTMGDIARCSIGKVEDHYNEDLLYRTFGVNAELLIDHAWGVEPCTIADIRRYRPSAKSLGSGQVLAEPYTYEKAWIVIREMVDSLSLDLVEKHLVTDGVVLHVGYDAVSLKEDNPDYAYHGEIKADWYGKMVPKPGHGNARLDRFTSSTRLLTEAVEKIYRECVDPGLYIRRINIAFMNLQDADKEGKKQQVRQLDLFAEAETAEKDEEAAARALEKEKRAQEAILSIRKKFGKNAILKGTSLEEGATGIERNKQIGGHKQ